MKKLILSLIGMFSFTICHSANLKLTTTVSAPVDSVGSGDGSASLTTGRPGLLFKFELPQELQNAQIDLAYLRFKVQSDTTKKGMALLVRPMLAPWVSGLRMPTMPDSVASPFHVNFGIVSLKSGKAELEITQQVRAWQEGELPNFGFLVYPAVERTNALQVRNLPGGGVAELEVFYTPEEKQ